MKSLIKKYVVVCFSLFISGCSLCFDYDPEYIKIYFDKVGVVGNGIDKIFIGCNVYNDDDQIIPNLKPNIFIDGEIFTDEYYSTNIPGYYTVTAKYSSLTDKKILPAFSLGNDAESAVSGVETINVGLSYQQTQVWCWAACAQMVLKYYNCNYSQSTIVTYVFGAPYVTTANDNQLICALNGLGNMDARVVFNPLSFITLQQNINKGMPLIAAYQGSFSGHVVVIYGYDKYGNIYIRDPYYGSFIVPYSATFLYNMGSMVWSRTFINLKKIETSKVRSIDKGFLQNNDSATILNIENSEVDGLEN